MFTIALIGNPNSGKTSLFNALTGLNQKVGNFPGVTVEKKTGALTLPDGQRARVVDLPGTYSLYPRSKDEEVTCRMLLDPQSAEKPDLLVLIADASNLRRSLLFCSQIMDLKLPVLVALTMNDIARRKGIDIDLPELGRQMGVPVVAVNPRRNTGTAPLKKAISALMQLPAAPRPDFIDLASIGGGWLPEAAAITGTGGYRAVHTACAYLSLDHLQAAQKMHLAAALDQHGFQKAKFQAEEITLRYRRIAQILQQSVHEDTAAKKALFSDRLDKVLLHPLWGNLILLGVLFCLFQSIFWLAQYPMQWVENLFALASGFLKTHLPAGWLSDLLVDGLLAGLSGIAIFIPQIMILFGGITLLEDSGYMARISFLTDRLMRSAGLSGRSVMPLISGMACAVPAIMSARTIQNKRERLITILITPLMSCSARLPVYIILIGLVIPNYTVAGVFSLQGLVLMGLYLLGFAMALLVSRVMSLLVRVRERSFFLLELPVYRAPRWKNVGTSMVSKAQVFVRDAGKIILVISLALWLLSSYGPRAGTTLPGPAPLEHSYAGRLGQGIEPLIRPLGFDWKIGIALVTSFAAREVFVGTMATLYSVESGGERTLSEKMRHARRPDGTPVYDLATGLSLMVFYVFAMQCMSTLAIVKRETGTWRYALLQFAYMFVLAYGCSWLTFRIFS